MEDTEKSEEAAPAAPPKNPLLWVFLGLAALAVLAGVAAGAFALTRARQPASGAAEPTSGVVTVPLSGTPAETSVASPSVPATATTTSAPAAPPVAKKPPTHGSAALDEKSAVLVASTFLENAEAGRTSLAKRLMTPHYVSTIRTDFFGSAKTGLKQFEVWKTKQEGAAWVIVMKETWADGVKMEWYKVVTSGQGPRIDASGAQ